MNPINQSPETAQISTLRWQTDSKRYKKDIIIKILAIATVTALGTALITATLMTVSLPLPIMAPICVGKGAFFLACVLKISDHLHPHVYRAFHKENVARKVCREIKQTFDKIPTQIKSSDLYNSTVKKINVWQRYGFLTTNSKILLIKFLQTDRADKKTMERIKERGMTAHITHLSDKRELTAKLWKFIVTRGVILELPFAPYR